MKQIFVFLVGLLVFGAPSVEAQIGRVSGPVKNWVSGWAGAVLDPPNIADPTTNTRWQMGTGLAFGGGVHHQLGQGLMIGIDGSYAPSVPFEFHDINSDVLLQPKQNARIATAMLSGRLQYGGGASFGIYLSGGLGGFFWGVPALTPTQPLACACAPQGSHWDGDVGLLTAPGFEYRAAARTALFLEYGRFWVFHQHEGVSSNSLRFTGIKFGGRVGV